MRRAAQDVSHFFWKADTLGLKVRGSASIRRFLANPRALRAIRTFNVTHMSRGRNAYQASHCYSVAGSHEVGELSGRRNGKVAFWTRPAELEPPRPERPARTRTQQVRTRSVLKLRAPGRIRTPAAGRPHEQGLSRFEPDRCSKLARPAGFEPATSSLEGSAGGIRQHPNTLIHL